MKYKTIIGLETHIELSTERKMFCGCSANYFGQKANKNVCPVCLGLPGALPVVNKEAVDWTILIGLALNCKINLNTYFERKHYFYPDLPKGYQISQYAKPLCYDGYLEVNGTKIRINRVHLEEDTGKLIHQNHSNDTSTYIDFNRSGVPLVEIVTEANITSPAQAASYLRKLQLVVQYLKASKCNMEKGSMRLEPNISLAKPLKNGSFSTSLPNYKVEIKNINSFRYVEKAIKYEQKRQSQLLDERQTPKQETRRYVEGSGQTQSMRSKEYAEDYRYFPEPDIPPLCFSKAEINSFKKRLAKVELPQQREDYFVKHCLLNKQIAKQLTENKPLGDKFLHLLKQTSSLNKNKLANLLINKKVSLSLNDKQLLLEIKSLLNKKEVSENTLRETVREVIKKNPQATGDYQKGKQTAVQFLLGQCLAILGRQIEVGALQKILTEELSLKQ